MDWELAKEKSMIEHQDRLLDAQLKAMHALQSETQKLRNALSVYAAITNSSDWIALGQEDNFGDKAREALKS